MAGLDRTGPAGKGPRTGRGLGRCNPQNEKPEDDTARENLQVGKGLGRGRGRGIGKGIGRGRGLGRS